MAASGSLGHPSVAQQVVPVRVALQCKGISHDQQGAARAGEANVDPALVGHEPDAAAFAGAHRGEDGHLLLAALHKKRTTGQQTLSDP